MTRLRFAAGVALLLASAGCESRSSAAAASPSGPAIQNSPFSTASPGAIAASPAQSPTYPIQTAASYARTQPGPTTTNAGSISGLANCACDGLPSQDVYAISTDGSRFYATQIVTGQTNWQMLGVAPGHYYVYAAERSAQVAGGTYGTSRRFASGYTVAVACGLSVSCTDHSPVVVTVTPGADTGGVETFDWYSNDFPLVPSAGPPEPFLKATPPFATSGEAAAYQVVVATAATPVAGPADCAANRACVWLVSRRNGIGAAYYIEIAGVNGQYISCGLYLFGDGAGWHTYDSRCGTSAVFPAVGAEGHVRLGMGETGCVNVRDSPSLSARIVACLVAGTSVAVDDGPNYVPSGLGPGTDIVGNSYWWHLAGLGWMVHPHLGG